MTAHPSRETRTLAPAAALLLLLHSHPLPIRAAHVPFGYQSDSSAQVGSSSDGNLASDPSSYAGSVHYDPLHHALYVTGATFAQSVFDGEDVFGVAKEEAELEDELEGNDAFWWGDSPNGIRPHLEDPGVPAYRPAGGDCFYAVLGLPRPDRDGAPLPREGDDDAKLIHSRRFGSEGAREACSAIDMLFASPREGAPGGYLHDFEEDFYEEMMAEEFEDEFNEEMNEEEIEKEIEDQEEEMIDKEIEEALMLDGSGAAPAPAPGASGGMQQKLDPSPTPLTNTGPQPQNRFRALGEDGGSLPGGAGAVVHKGQSPRGRQRHRQHQQRQLRDRPLAKNQQRQRSAQSGGKFGKRAKTRSVRLLMAGHVESPTGQDGYLVDRLEPGDFDEARVYAFAQQVDVRLPPGDMGPDDVDLEAARLASGEGYDELDYLLHAEGKEELGFKEEPGGAWRDDSRFVGLVTSGVESRALLNEDLPASLGTVYPVAIAADATSKRHYYVAMLASDGREENAAVVERTTNDDPTIGEGATQRSWTDFEDPPDSLSRETGDYFGERGLPDFGRDFRVVVKKMAIEADADPTGMTDVEAELAGASHAGATIAMRGEWMEQFEPDGGEDVRPGGLLFAPSGDPTGAGDMLILVGTTAGRGSAFGTLTGVPGDLDGFVMKIRADEGGFAGHEKFDLQTNQFENTYSKRIRSNPGQTDVAAGVCARPLRGIGSQDATTHVYVVGSTSALLAAIPKGVRDRSFLDDYPERKGSEPMEAFLTKIDLKTMNTVWTVQVGAYVPGEDGKGTKGDAFGYGCAVTHDGDDVHLSGLVKAGGVATDFSAGDLAAGRVAAGGTDAFVASYSAANGSRNFLRQIGSNRDDSPSRGNGGIASDRAGNAILAGSTRGSLMRARGADEYRYGATGAEAASDVFVVSLARGTGEWAPAKRDLPPDEAMDWFDCSCIEEEGRCESTETCGWTGKGCEVDPDQSTAGEGTPAPAVAVATSPPAPSPSPAQPALEGAAGEGTRSAAGGVVLLCFGFVLLATVGYGFAAYRINLTRKREKRALKENSVANLQDRGDGGPVEPYWGFAWGTQRKRTTMDELNDLDIVVDVRNSASGGWHGVYDEQHLQTVDFGAPVEKDAGEDDVVEGSLFMEEPQGLKEIEESMDNYEIGDMDDVSDEDLIKAYNDAMALDIEPENFDVEFAMQGIGSGNILNEDDHHKIT